MLEIISSNRQDFLTGLIDCNDVGQLQPGWLTLRIEILIPFQIKNSVNLVDRAVSILLVRGRHSLDRIYLFIYFVFVSDVLITFQLDVSIKPAELLFAYFVLAHRQDVSHALCRGQI